MHPLAPKYQIDMSSGQRRVKTNAIADESGQVMSDLQVIIPRRFDIDLKPMEIPEDILVRTYSLSATEDQP
jgi:hypothetical protein